MEQGQKPREYYEDEHGVHPLFGIVWHEVGTDGEPAFENSWTNVGGDYATCAFGLDTGGRLQLKGRVDGGEADTAIFTLPASPVNFRPDKIQCFAVATVSGPGQLLADIDGVVKLVT